MLRLLLLGLFSVLFSVVAAAQQPLARARQSSYLTKVFRLTNEQAEYLYEHNLAGARPEFFRQPVDSFPTDSAARYRHRPLPPGYYLVAHTEGPQLVYWLRSETDRQVLVLDNQVDLTLLVRDSLGRLIPDAQVALARRPVPYDAATRTYRLPKAGRSGLLAVSYRGRTTFHMVERTFPYPRDEDEDESRWHRRVRRAPGVLLRAGHRVVFGFPLAYISHPVRRLVNDLRHASNVSTGLVGLLRSPFNEDVRDERQERRAEGGRRAGHQREQWVSYVAFSKPKYRPSGDTLRLKIRLLRRPDGRPCRQPLTLWLSGEAAKDRKLAELRPVRPGSYEYTLPLADSLNLRADTYVQVRLATRRGATLASGQFRLEDYELKNTRYTLRVAEKEHLKGARQAVFLRGTDANELNLLDARVRLSLTPAGGPGAFADRQLFMPDTLWQHAGPLDAVGETKLDVPAQAFPATDFSYAVRATFLNADNERREESTTVPYRQDAGKLLVELIGDSVQLRYLHLGQSRAHRARLEVAGGTELQTGPLFSGPVRLPLTLPLAATAFDYTLSDSLGRKASLSLDETNARLALRSERTHDSIFLTMENPRRLQFWYYVYRANRLVQRGYAGPGWRLALPARTAAPWYVSVHYLWGEEMLSQEYNVPLLKRQLLIQSDMPGVAYPGQRLRLNFTVTDGGGRPVPYADLTAYAYTSKFEQAQAAPELPSFERPVYGRQSLRRFEVDGASFENSPAATRQQLLAWRSWRTQLGLDSLRFYQFLYPDYGQFFEYRPAPGGLTQLAPFVVDSGRVQPPIAVYVDGVPVYAHDVNQHEPYSFVTDSGHHTVSIRTARHLVTLRDVYLRHLHKLTLSIDLNHPCAEMRVESRPVFSAQEQLALSRYFLLLDADASSVLLRQGNRLQAVETGYVGQLRLAGPFRPDSVLLRRADGLRRKFLFEPLFRYTFQPGLLKMRCAEAGAFGPLSGYGFPGQLPLDGFAHTEATLREALAVRTHGRTTHQATSGVSYPYHTQYWNARLTNPGVTPAGQGRLEIRLPAPLPKQAPVGWAPVHFLLITKPGAPKFQRLLAGTPTVHALPPGRYRVAALLADSSCWAPADLVEIRAGGTTYFQLRATDLRKPGSLSRRIGRLVRQLVPPVSPVESREARREVKVERPVVAPKDWPVLRGRVIDRNTEEGLPGVTVLVKGTTTGTSTQADGTYALAVPPDAETLLFSSVGFLMVERRVQGAVIDVALAADTKQLSEVVVTGYGVQHSRRELAGAVSSVTSNALQGRVAGVQIGNGNPAASGEILIRGSASLSSNNSPLVIVDGLPFVGQVKDIDPASIANMKTLSGEQAVGTYGTRAANGVLIITTKTGTASAGPDGSGFDPRLALRRNFSDVGWWRPTLVTDAQGRASTTVTLPDDVTGWNAFVLGSDQRGRVGSSTGLLRSFKGLLGELAVPRFLVAGDRVQVIGKTLNYLPDTAQVTTTFRVGGAEVRRQQHRVSTSVIDTLTVTAPATADSLQLTFGLMQPSGYQDGEQRRIPVLPAGTRERIGSLLTLVAPDTTVQLPAFDPALGEVTLRVESDPLPAILSEIQHVQAYAYFCNEQAASKLKTLLLEQRIRVVRNEDFKGERAVNYLVRKLLKGQHQPEGLWGTWPTSPVSPWATTHVLEALLDAEKAGYKVSFDRDKVEKYLLQELNATLADVTPTAYADRWYYRSPDDQIRLLGVLHRLGTQTDYRTYLQRLDLRTRPPRGRQLLDRYLALTELRQQLKLPYQLDTLRHYRLRTALGGVYYADTLHPGYYYRHVLHNTVGTTLLAYRVLRQQGGHNAELARMRVYLLGLRNSGHWRSTFEAAQILETIGPDLFAPGRAAAFARVELSGGLSQQVTKFPYEVKVSPTTAPVTVRKEGTLPVYATAYQTFWNPAPAAQAAPFKVTTILAGQADNRVKLRAGQPVELLVTVEATAEARYVLVEVPIPAGCSYGDKAPQNYFEVHREYLRHQTGIFIDKLPAGRHTFRIALQPRYRGRYTVNPAKAEMMYFPTRFGRSASKQAVVD